MCPLLTAVAPRPLVARRPPLSPRGRQVCTFSPLSGGWRSLLAVSVCSAPPGGVCLQRAPLWRLSAADPLRCVWSQRAPSRRLVAAHPLAASDRSAPPRGVWPQRAPSRRLAAARHLGDSLVAATQLYMLFFITHDAVLLTRKA